MSNIAKAVETGQPPAGGNSRTCQSIEWYGEGQIRVVEVDGVRITIRFVGRRGRRGRIAITAPPGTLFRSAEVEGRDSGVGRDVSE
jgi:hypothetical protein